MRYNLIACDYDDTLLPAKKEISEYTLDTIHRFVEAGGHFVICSGRMFQSISKVARGLGLHGEVITFQGALTKNVDTGEVIDMTEIPVELAREYVHFMKGFPVVVQVYVNDKLYVDIDNPYSRRYADFCGVNLNVVGDYDKFFDNITEPINKVYCYMDPSITDDVRSKALEKFSDRLLINSSKPYNVEAIDIHASKGIAIRKLAKHYNIPMSEVMTFGDNLNDMTMIDFEAFSVAVGNAVPKLKEKAKYISEDCADDGVAKTIEKFCLR